jgi:hypothetical protein
MFPKQELAVLSTIKYPQSSKYERDVSILIVMLCHDTETGGSLIAQKHSQLIEPEVMRKIDTRPNTGHKNSSSYLAGYGKSLQRGASYPVPLRTRNCRSKNSQICTNLCTNLHSICETQNGFLNPVLTLIQKLRFLVSWTPKVLEIISAVQCSAVRAALCVFLLFLPL